MDVDEALAKLRRAIASPELKPHAKSAGRCLDFKIECSEKRFWSPHLSVQLSEADAGAEVFGRYSPRPEIWTMVMAIYFAAAFCIITAALFGYAQWSLGMRPWALVAIPIGASVIVGLHAASLIGQRLSADQMRLLRSRFDRAMELAFCDQGARDQPVSG
ncbi:MAG: hypothetical protein KDA37_07700 [Planctomycetales bacterium]|nr:hypothetical protein [Planctomycetales bacterium]